MWSLFVAQIRGVSRKFSPSENDPNKTCLSSLTEVKAVVGVAQVRALWTRMSSNMTGKSTSFGGFHSLQKNNPEDHRCIDPRSTWFQILRVVSDFKLGKIRKNLAVNWCPLVYRPKRINKKSSFESSQSCPKRAVISECPGQPSPPNFQKAVCLKFGINFSDHIGSNESTV